MPERIDVHPANLLKGMFKRRVRTNGGSVSDFELKTHSYLGAISSSIDAIFKQNANGVPQELKVLIEQYTQKVSALATEFSSTVWTWATSKPGWSGDGQVEVLKDVVVRLTMAGKFEEAKKLADLISGQKYEAATKYVAKLGDAI
jgi:hypothetical protein